MSQRDHADTTEPAALGFGPGVPAPSPYDGWIGTRDLPGYRAGNVIAKLEELPAAGEPHLYFDLLLLDAFGHTEDNHSGRCYAMGAHPSLDERSRFVRIVAELLRHVSYEPHGLSSLGRALMFIREHGIGPGKLAAAAQLIDDACTARTVIASLLHILKLSLGEDDAHLVMSGVVEKLARSTGFDEFELAQGSTLAATRAFQRRVSGINDGGLVHQVAFVVRGVGKARARRYLRDATDFDMLPSPEMFGV